MDNKISDIIYPTGGALVLSFDEFMELKNRKEKERTDKKEQRRTDNERRGLGCPNPEFKKL